MKYTWFCLLLISFSVCKGEESKPTTTEVKSRRTLKDSLILYTKRYINFMKKSPYHVKRFLKWIKKPIQYGIQRIGFGNNMIKYRTEDWSNVGGVKTIRKLINISMTNTEDFNKIFRNSNPNTKQFLNWIKQNIQNGIRCVDIGIDPMECETNSGSKFNTNLQVWNELPYSIQQQWATTTISNNLPKGVKISID